MYVCMYIYIYIYIYDYCGNFRYPSEFISQENTKNIICNNFKQLLYGAQIVVTTRRVSVKFCNVQSY